MEIFLIGIAALANLSFLDQPACEYLNQFSTMQVLIENFYLKSFNSIFVKDQVKKRKESSMNVLIEVIIKDGNNSGQYGPV